MEREPKINILFVLIQVRPGGSEKIVLDLTRNLDRSKFNIYLAFFLNGALEKDFRETCQGVFSIRKKDGFDLIAMLRISRIIEEKHIDVINAHHYMPFFYSYLGSKILHKRKLFYTEHSVPEVESILLSKHKYLFSLMLRKTDGVIGVSREIADTFKKAFPRYSERIQSIFNGLDVDRFVTSIDRNEIRSKWGILPEHFVIGTIANFRKVKNHACLIRAFNRLSATYPHVRLILVGKGYPEDKENSEEEVRYLIQVNGLQERVILTGYQEDIPGLLKTFDVFCLPSFSEGLPVSVLEAMAAGVPVVGSDVRGIREVISQEVTGLMFPSDDDGALAQTLKRLIEKHELCDALTRQAFAYVSQTHGLGQWVSAYEGLFQL